MARGRNVWLSGPSMRPWSVVTSPRALPVRVMRIEHAGTDAHVFVRAAGAELVVRILPSGSVAAGNEDLG